MKSLDSRLDAVEKLLPTSPYEEVFGWMFPEELRVFMDVLDARKASGNPGTMTSQEWEDRGQFEFAKSLRETVAHCRAETLGADKIDVPSWKLSFEDRERAAEGLRCYINDCRAKASGELAFEA